MRNVVVYELLSLDGVAQDPNEFVTNCDDAMDSHLAAVISTQDLVILGRRSYDEWAAFWPGSDIEPFATFINGVTKYVATSAPLAQKCAGCTVIDGELVEFVRELKTTQGGDIGVHASISVAQSLLAQGSSMSCGSSSPRTSPGVADGCSMNYQRSASSWSTARPRRPAPCCCATASRPPDHLLKTY